MITPEQREEDLRRTKEADVIGFLKKRDREQAEWRAKQGPDYRKPRKIIGNGFYGPIREGGISRIGFF